MEKRIARTAQHFAKFQEWSEEQIELLRCCADDEVMRLTGSTAKAIHYKRNHLGIPNPAAKLRRWTEGEDALLGSEPDGKVAQRLGRAAMAVKARRCLLGIAAAGWGVERCHGYSTTFRVAEEFLRRSSHRVATQDGRASQPLG